MTGTLFAYSLTFMDTNKSQALIDQAAEYGSAAIQTLVEVMSDDWAKPADRVSAAVHLLERGHGKPVQPTSLLPPAQGAESVNQLTDAALLAIIAGARRKAVTVDGEGEVRPKTEGPMPLRLETAVGSSTPTALRPVPFAIEGGEGQDSPGDEFEENAVGNFPAAPETAPLAKANDPASQILQAFRARQSAARDWPEHTTANPSEFPNFDPAAQINPLLL